MDIYRFINSPDMSTPEGYHHESYPSLHKKLEQAIAYEEVYDKRAFAVLKQHDRDAVYSYKIDGSDWKSVFSDFDLAFSYIKNYYECEEAHTIQVKKIF